MVFSRKKKRFSAGMAIVLAVFMVLSAAPMASFAESPVLSFALMSDTHIESSSPTNWLANNLRNALNDAGKVGFPVTATLIAGDITNTGSAAEYVGLKSVLSSMTTKKNLFAIGNHDSGLFGPGWNSAWDSFKNTLSPYAASPITAPYYDAWISGYHFIVLGTEAAPQNNAYISDAQIKWLRQKLAEKADINRPIFVLCHQPLANTFKRTEQSAENIGASGETIRALFKQYPQVVYMTGHVHNGIGYSGPIIGNGGTFVDLPSMKYNNYGNPSRTMMYYVQVYPTYVQFRARDFANAAWTAQYDFRVNTVRETGNAAFVVWSTTGNTVGQKFIIKSQDGKIEFPVVTQAVSGRSIGFIKKWNLPTGTYTATPVNALSQYEPLTTQTFTVKKGQTTEVDFIRVKKAPSGNAAIVFWSESGDTVGREVVIKSKDGTRQISVVTQAVAGRSIGFIKKWNLPEGEYTATPVDDLPQYEPLATQTFTIKNGQTTEVDFVLKQVKVGNAAVVFWSESGDTVGREVVIKSKDGTRRFSVVTQAVAGRSIGMIKKWNLPEGEYTATPVDDLPQYEPLETQTFIIKNGKMTEVDFVLKQKQVGNVAVVVWSATGNTVGQEVIIRSNDGSLEFPVVTEPVEGRTIGLVRKLDLPAGVYTAEPINTLSEYEDLTTQIFTIKKGETTEVDFVRVKKEEPTQEEPDPEEPPAEEPYTLEDNRFIHGISPLTTVGTFRQKLSALEQEIEALTLPDITLQITDSSGVKGEGALVGTGDVLIIEQAGVVRGEYMIVIRGDLNGDGQVDENDYSLLTITLGEGADPLTEAQQRAGDINGDHMLNSGDCIAFKTVFTGI